MDQPDTREWLATNGLGGYASGTACGANTRRYHGLLVAALEPPGQRHVLLSRLDETVIVGGEVYELGANFWSSGSVAPQGYHHLKSFQASPVPTWEYQVGLGRLVKRVACLPGQNAVAISYRLEGGPPIRLEMKVLANSRDFHGETHGHPDWQFRQRMEDLTPDPSPARRGERGSGVRSPGLRIAAWDGAPEWSLTWDRNAEVEYRPGGQWYWGYSYPEEAARGLPSVEDNYCVGFLGARLAPGERLDLLASVEPLTAWPTADELADDADRRRRVLVTQAGLPETPEAERLIVGADQFLVRRASTDGPTVIAGYHWFGDWGRDTMIALPGLTLTTRRFEEARGILRTFARYVDRGMLPNRFPDGDEAPEYNTVDATLWWFHALDRYHRACDDDELVREQFPLLAEVVDWHIRGTRHGIRVDPQDGLLLAGEPGVQLTWMDARIGDWVVTPRYGKPVEVNALWFNALSVMARFADHLSKDGTEFRYLAARAKNGMQQFWSERHGYLYDTIGTDSIGDSSLRPNQLFAFSLPNRAFNRAQGERVLSVVQERLLTPYGPRSLAPGSPGYDGQYAGDSYHRDSVYHQGAVWPWLLGAYADALVNVRGLTAETRTELRDRIQPLLRHLVHDACLGSVSEIFDGDLPHAPNGAAAQAWSVAELLRIYALTVESAPAAVQPAPGLATV
jgi:predicted glycogen debranching enzyme